MGKPAYYSPAVGIDGFTELMHFARWGNVGGVKKEIKKGVNLQAQDQSGFTALIWNCRMGGPAEYRQRKRIHRLLVQAGASVSIKDIAGKDVFSNARHFAPKPLRRFVSAELARLRRRAK